MTTRMALGFGMLLASAGLAQAEVRSVILPAACVSADGRVLGQVLVNGVRCEAYLATVSQAGRPAPLSNPRVAPFPLAPAPGFEAVWQDGRINPYRGLPPRLLAGS